jgi:hypothetical protein
VDLLTAKGSKEIIMTRLIDLDDYYALKPEGCLAFLGPAEMTVWARTLDSHV